MSRSVPPGVPQHVNYAMRIGLLHAVIYLVVVVSATKAYSNKRYPDESFANSTVLLGRNLTCDGSHHGDMRFPAITRTCHDMRVDGLRIRYWYVLGFGASENGCSDGKNAYDSRNDVHALCGALLKAHGLPQETKNDWTTFVNDASCRSSPEERMVFALKDGVYRWEKFPAGRGHIKTLRCMVDK